MLKRIALFVMLVLAMLAIMGCGDVGHITAVDCNEKNEDGSDRFEVGDKCYLTGMPSAGPYGLCQINCADPSSGKLVCAKDPRVK